MIKTRNLDPESPGRYHYYTGIHEFAASTNLSARPLFTCAVPKGQKIVDIFVSQSVAGGGGTSLSAVVKKNGTTVCSTESVLARTDSDLATVNAKASLAKPAGATRPVLKTDGTATLAVGDDVTFDINLTGTYSTTFPKVIVTVVTEGIY